MPGVPAPALRPVQANPVEQVPLLPVPQQGWPSPPQVPHWLPPGNSRQDSVAPH